MAYSFFENTFKNLQLPVVVCLDTDKYPIVFANNRAKMMTNPQLTIEKLKEGASADYVDDVLFFSGAETKESFFSSLRVLHSISNYSTTLLDFEGNLLPVMLSANTVDVQGNDYFIIYVYEKRDAGDSSSADTDDMLFTAFQLAYHTDDVDEAINKILAFVGAYANVSRVYIFEEESAVYTRNTYEWCADGIEPAIQDLQHLRKDEYNYDVIINSGMYITDDIRDLPDNDREILETQGIKSLAILPLFQGDHPLGYIGFDDCLAYRKWSSTEIRLLGDIASIIVSLLVRRNSESQARRSLDILQTITDNIDNAIYVTDPETYEIIFTNRALTEAFGIEHRNIVGKTCWQTLYRGKREPCDFCPLRQMFDEDGNVIKPTVVWERQDAVTGRWYLVKDSLIEWVDGRKVHIQTATEITHQKANEEKLRLTASIDSMTGAYNREWGYRIMQEMRGYTDTDVSLVFIDLDDLKNVNDRYGHDAGDEKIIKTVETIRSSVRQSDVLIRWGGDEFILLLQCNAATAKTIMSNIDKKLKTRKEQDALPFTLSVSYGVMPLSDDDRTVDEIIANADRSMYKSKVTKR